MNFGKNLNLISFCGGGWGEGGWGVNFDKEPKSEEKILCGGGGGKGLWEREGINDFLGIRTQI